MSRIPIEGDILPLTKPIVGTSGKVYTELPIPRGTPVTISTIGYNLYVFPAKQLPSRQNAQAIVYVAGTRVYGVRTHTSSDQSVGSK